MKKPSVIGGVLVLGKVNSLIHWALIVLAVLLASSQMAWAAPTTLICDTSAGNAVGPGTIDLDETGGSITIYYPPSRNYGGNPDPMPAGLLGTFPAKFEPGTISFVWSKGPGVSESVTINRQTGVFVMNGVTWTCHLGKAQF